MSFVKDGNYSKKTFVGHNTIQKLILSSYEMDRKNGIQKLILNSYEMDRSVGIQYEKNTAWGIASRRKFLSSGYEFGTS